MQRKDALKSRILSSSWITDISLLCVFSFIFYICWLGAYPLFTPDEGRYSEVAREMIATGDYITPRVNGVAFLDKPILYYWLQAISIHLFGIKEWALRLFPVLFGILGCVVTYISGRHLFNRRAGFIAALILATTPLYFVGTHYANLDLEVAVSISCTLLFFILGIQRQDSSRHYFFFLAYLFSAFAFLTKGLIGIVFPTLIIGTWILLRRRFDLLLKVHLIKGIVLFTLIVTPWYYLVQKANPEFLHYFFVTQQVSRFLSTHTFNNPTPFWFYLPIVLIGFFPWSNFVLPALRSAFQKAKQAHPIELYLLLWTGIVFIFFSIPHSKVITYILPIFPPLALLVGNYLSTLLEKQHPPRIFFFIANLLFAAVLLASTYLIEIPTAFLFYLKAMTLIFIATTVLILFVKTYKSLFITLLSTNILFLLCFTAGATYLNNESAKPLITYLKPMIQPEDEVIHYHKFFQDVPLYLQRRVSIAEDWDSPRIAHNDNWAREFWYGMPFQDTSQWLISEETFWKRWNEKKRVFVFLQKKYFDQFKAHHSVYYVLAQHNHIFLLSNHPAG